MNHESGVFMRKVAVCTTTINKPLLLEKYAEAAKQCQDQMNVEIFFVVAGDRKTPAEANHFCLYVEKEYGIEITYLTPLDQIQMFPDLKNFTSLIGWDCIQRRNFAGLMALRKGAEVIIYLDDDNLILSSEYFQEHLNALFEPITTSMAASSKFVNIMASSEGSGISKSIVPRGFPFAIRGERIDVQCLSDDNSKVAANAGLWIEEADIDAVTRIALQPKVLRYQQKNNVKLAKCSWTPLNSQNTSFLSKFLVGYFLSDQVGRYDDIYAGYVFQKLINSFDHTVSFGNPVVVQERNQHDLLEDLSRELDGMRNVDFIIDFIRNLNAQGQTPLEFMESLLDQWEMNMLDLPKNLSSSMHLHSLLHGYRMWLYCISQISQNAA